MTYAEGARVQITRDGVSLAAISADNLAGKSGTIERVDGTMRNGGYATPYRVQPDDGATSYWVAASHIVAVADDDEPEDVITFTQAQKETIARIARDLAESKHCDEWRNGVEEALRVLGVVPSKKPWMVTVWVVADETLGRWAVRNRVRAAINDAEVGVTATDDIIIDAAAA